MSSGTGRTVGIMALGLASGGLAAGLIAGGALAGTAFGSILVGAAYMGGSFLGQMIFPASNPRDMPSAPGYPMQTVDKGSPVKVTYGTLRVAGNLVWMGPLSHYHVSGGKGGGDDGPENYRRSFLISICEGPRSVLRMWKGKTEIDITLGSDNKTGTIGSLFAGVAQEVTVFNGDGYNEGLETLIGEDYSNYKYDCCVLFKNYDLGPQESIPAFVFEVGPYQPQEVWIGNGRGVTKYDLDFVGQGSVTGLPTFDTTILQHDIDASGNMVLSLNVSYGETVHYYDVAETQTDLKPYPGVKGWADPDYLYNCLTAQGRGCAFSVTGDYAYVSVESTWTYTPNVGHRYHLYKINVRTGDLVWRWPDNHLGYQGLPSRVRVDAGDNAYMLVNGYNGTNLSHVHKIKPNGHAEEGDDSLYSLVPNGYIRDIWIDEDFVVVEPDTGKLLVGFLFASGRADFDGGTSHYYFATWKYLRDPSYWSKQLYPARDLNVYGWSRQFTTIKTYNNLVYVCGTRMYGDFGEDTDAVQIYNGWGTKLAGWDCGESDYKPDPLYQARCTGLALNTEGKLVVAVQSNDVTYVLSAGTLTEIDSYTTPFHKDAGIGEVHAFAATDVKDANPADIIYDLCVNRRSGASIPADYINGTSFVQIHQYCQTNDLLISVEINSSRSIIDWIQFICSHFGGFPFWVGGQLYLGAWRSEDAAFHITRDHLVVDEDGGIPVQIKKRDYSQSVNHIELGWQDRDNI